MPDITAICREIDGLHANATPSPWKVLHQTGGDFAGVIAGGGSRRKGTRPDIAYMANGSGSPDHLIIAALFNAWPAISRALADAEADRRKARAWDAVKDNIHPLEGWTGQHEGYVCDSRWRENHPASKAIEAALAAKETQ